MSGPKVTFYGTVNNSHIAEKITEKVINHNDVQVERNLQEIENFDKPIRLPQEHNENEINPTEDELQFLKDQFLLSYIDSEEERFRHRITNGYVFVINNEEFLEATNRLSSSKDVEKLKEFFKEELLWEDFYFQNNMKAEAIEEKIKEISEKDFQKHSAFFLFILSHGTENGIMGVDSKEVNIESCLEHFSAEKCPSLAGKPKFFIIQACRGVKDDKEYNLVETDAIIGSPSKMICIPNLSDYVIAYPCVPGYTALRHDNGSFFIQALVHIMKNRLSKDHFVEMLSKVGNLVSETTNSLTVKQMPCIDIRIGKKCYFDQYFKAMAERVNRY